MTMYYAKAWGIISIETVEITSETPKTVTLDGRKRLKRTTEDFFTESFEEAKEWLIRQLERKVETQKWQLQREQDRLGNAKGLKDPAKK